MQKSALKSARGSSNAAKVSSVTSPTADEWTAAKAKMKKGSAWWRRKRLAHIFDDGWDEGTFQGREKNHLVFYYKSANIKYAHSLELEEHGVAKSWVVIDEP